MPVPPFIQEARIHVASFLKNGCPDKTEPIYWEIILGYRNVEDLGCSEKDTATLKSYLSYLRVWRQAQRKGV